MLQKSTIKNESENINRNSASFSALILLVATFYSADILIKPDLRTFKKFQRKFKEKGSSRTFQA